MECAIVTLALHEELLDLPFLVGPRSPICDDLERDEATELVKRQVRDLVLVASEPVHHLRSHHVVESLPMRCRHVLHTLAQEVTVELEEEADERNVLRWNKALERRVVGVPETRILRRVEPRVVAVQSDEHVVLVLVVYLIKDFCDRVGGEVLIRKSNVDEVDHLLGLGAFVSKSVI